MKVKLSLLLCLLAIPAPTQTTVLDDIVVQCHTTWWDLPLKQKAKRIVHPQGLQENLFYVAMLSNAANSLLSKTTSSPKMKDLEDITKYLTQKVALGAGAIAGTWLTLSYLRSLINRDLTPEQIAENLIKPFDSQNKPPYQTMLRLLNGSEINFIEKIHDLYPNSYIGCIDINFLKTSLHQVLDQMNAISKYNDAKYEPLKTNIISTTHQLTNMQKALSITNDFFAGAIEPYKSNYDLILAGASNDDIIKFLVNPNTKPPIKDLYLAAEEHLESFINRLNTLNQQQYSEAGFEFFRERNQKIMVSLQSILNSLRSSPEFNRVKREKQYKNNKISP